MLNSDKVACSLTTGVIESVPTTIEVAKEFIRSLGSGSVEDYKRINSIFSQLTFSVEDREPFLDFLLVNKWSSCAILVEVVHFFCFHATEEDAEFLVCFCIPTVFSSLFI
jgi:hypothetical protein